MNIQMKATEQYLFLIKIEHVVQVFSPIQFN